ncbi:MAG: hypothetical protein DHS20C16_22940 [Phycisphaerae bacterium]|nr:MAG: hypothetical protein DHS20C16_22940 [Phycisphaerae bacterium]
MGKTTGGKYFYHDLLGLAIIAEFTSREVGESISKSKGGIATWASTGLWRRSWLELQCVSVGVRASNVNRDANKITDPGA